MMEQEFKHLDPQQGEQPGGSRGSAMTTPSPIPSLPLPPATSSGPAALAWGSGPSDT